MWMCVCVCADRLYFLSIYDADENGENARATVAGLFRIGSPFLLVSFLFFWFFSDVKNFFACNIELRKKIDEAQKIDGWMNATGSSCSSRLLCNEH